jgi:hypothetical protein
MRKNAGCYLDKHFDFIKTVNSSPTPEECTFSPSLNPEDANRLNEHINYAITEDEISRCIKKLNLVLFQRTG